MQDNFDNINEPEDVFLNDSWAKMSAMLEKEMPVEAPALAKESSGYGRYVTLLLLLMVLGGGYLVSNSFLDSARNSIDSARNSIDSARDDKSLGHMDEVQESTESSFLDSARNNMGSARVENTNSNTNSNPSESGSSSIALNVLSEGSGGQMLNSTLSEAIIKPVDVPLLLEKDEMNANSVKTILPISNSKVVVETELEMEKEVDVANLINVSPMILTSGDHPKLEEPELTTTSLIKIAPPTKKWSYGIMGGIQEEKINQGFGGFSIGFVANRKLAKNFTFETGLNFSLTQFNNTIINNSPTTISFNQPNPNTNSEIEEMLTLTYNPEDANPTENIHLGSASWLSLPVLLTYQPTRRWRINMGVEYAQLLRANSQKILNAADDEKGNITHLIAGNNISALTGVTWFPRKNIGIDIRYQFGFTDLSKANQKFIEQTDTRAALQWSLVYYFKAKN